jgi:cytochrome c2
MMIISEEVGLIGIKNGSVMSVERSDAKKEKMIIWTEKKTKQKFMSPEKSQNKTAMKSL